MKSNRPARMRDIALVVLVLGLVSCVKNSAPVSETDYATKIIGLWQGTVGDSLETMSIKKDGTFACRLRKTGFISSMIFPASGGTVRGTWTLSGAVITLRITGETHERVENSIATSTIMSFKADEMVLKSDRAGTVPFMRVHPL